MTSPRIGLRHLFYLEIASTVALFAPMLVVPRWLGRFFFGTGDVPPGTIYALTMYALVAIAWSLALLAGLLSESAKTRARVLMAAALGDVLMILVSLHAVLALEIVSLGSVTHAAVTAVYLPARLVALARPALL